MEKGTRQMNANELADELMKCSIPRLFYLDELMNNAAIMLRQQQAEIEALKQIIDANNLNQNIGQFVKPINEPVAWYNADESSLSFKNHGRGWQPLYTHPVKEQDESFDRTASHMAGEYVSYKAELTDEEINKLWAESHEDGIAVQQGFTTQQHYFAHLILRKAQE